MTLIIHVDFEILLKLFAMTSKNKSWI